jgi:TRAP transporter TAXI family solute receptor
MAAAGRLFLLCLLMAAALFASEPTRLLLAEEVKFIRIGTGPIGGTYFPVGGLIANIISGPPGSMACEIGGSCGVPGLIAAAVSTQGSVENVQDIANHVVDLAMCQANIAHDAYTGTGPYAGKPVEALRAMANLFPEAVHVVVRGNDGIKSVGDLRSRRVSVGEENSGTLPTAKIVLRGFGLTLKDIKPFYERLARSIDMLAAGEIDALFMVGAEPITAIAHAADHAPIALLPITGRDAERILAAQPFFSKTAIPANIYSGVPATETIGVGAQLLVSAQTDANLVYAITRALWDSRNRKVLDSGNPNGRRIQRSLALDDLAVPLHPGARRYYLESGLTQAGQL